MWLIKLTKISSVIVFKIDMWSVKLTKISYIRTLKFSLYRILYYSGFGLDRFHCISRKLIDQYSTSKILCSLYPYCEGFSKWKCHLQWFPDCHFNFEQNWRRQKWWKWYPCFISNKWLQVYEKDWKYYYKYLKKTKKNKNKNNKLNTSEFAELCAAYLNPICIFS